jgi:cytochrome c oxidase subunit 3
MDALRMRSPASPARTGVWIGIGAIVMSFGAYTSALVFRQGAAADWRHFDLPPLLYVNTLILLASSATMALGQRRIRWSWVQMASLGSGEAREGPDGLAWLYLTLVMGLLFLTGQVLAWQNLARQGLFVSTNPSSAFFYLLTVLHALHLLGGLGGLVYVLRRIHGEGARAEDALGAAALYWHFMDVLWVYLLLLLIVRL